MLRDDGVSGRLPLNKRSSTGGQQLVELVTAGAIDEVWFTRLDRVARRLRVLLDVHDFLQAHHVTMMADAEKVDTSTPTGELVFHVLGAIAQWETSTTAERSRNGKITKAPLGNYNGGVIAFGYAVDEDGNGVADDDALECGYSPSELVPMLMERIVAGGTATAQALWLTDLGVPSTQRYANYTKV
ncbi:MAG TPA: recombinase family protein, partial [Chloroflexota bacterium]|nr:recombinase family protein [Chloroflexota bacterium]